MTIIYAYKSVKRKKNFFYITENNIIAIIILFLLRSLYSHLPDPPISIQKK